MYIPAHFREEDRDTLFQFIRQNSFGLLVTASDGVPTATHLPFTLNAEANENGTLRAHLARANPQWRHLETEREILVVFSGEHSYISPTWYVNAPNVPTWNYTAVHIYGTPRILSDDEMRPLLVELTGQYEGEQGWSLDAVSTDYTEKLIRAIIGFEIQITRIEGKWKMSQNKPEVDKNSVIDALETQTAPMAQTVAAAMKSRLPDPKM